MPRLRYIDHAPFLSTVDIKLLCSADVITAAQKKYALIAVKVNEREID